MAMGLAVVDKKDGELAYWVGLWATKYASSQHTEMKDFAVSKEGMPPLLRWHMGTPMFHGKSFATQSNAGLGFGELVKDDVTLHIEQGALVANVTIDSVDYDNTTGPGDLTTKIGTKDTDASSSTTAGSTSVTIGLEGSFIAKVPNVGDLQLKVNRTCTELRSEQLTTTRSRELAVEAATSAKVGVLFTTTYRQLTYATCETYTINVKLKGKVLVRFNAKIKYPQTSDEVHEKHLVPIQEIFSDLLREGFLEPAERDKLLVYIQPDKITSEHVALTVRKTVNGQMSKRVIKPSIVAPDAAAGGAGASGGAAPSPTVAAVAGAAPSTPPPATRVAEAASAPVLPLTGSTLGVSPSAMAAPAPLPQPAGAGAYPLVSMDNSGARAVVTSLFHLMGDGKQNIRVKNTGDDAVLTAVPVNVEKMTPMVQAGLALATAAVAAKSGAPIAAAAGAGAAGAGSAVEDDSGLKR